MNWAEKNQLPQSQPKSQGRLELLASIEANQKATKELTLSY